MHAQWLSQQEGKDRHDAHTAEKETQMQQPGTSNCTVSKEQARSETYSKPNGDAPQLKRAMTAYQGNDSLLREQNKSNL
jgi:hypothetical protein